MHWHQRLRILQDAARDLGRRRRLPCGRLRLWLELRRRLRHVRDLLRWLGLGHAPPHLRHASHLGLRAKVRAWCRVCAVRALGRALHGVLHRQKCLAAGRTDQACRCAVVHGG